MRLFASFLLWLMMLAIPVQGFAAASMLYCGMGTEHHANPTQPAPESHQASQATVHMDLSTVAMDDLPGMVNDHAVQADDFSAKIPDSSHKCGVCAACCNLIGIPGVPSWMASAISPPTQYLEPLAQFYAAPSRLLDRPPRS